jgi:outer membrane protein TolC
VRQARATGRALEERRAELRQALRSGLDAARVLLRAAEEQCARAAERADLERQRLGFVEARFRQGIASESERLDAEDDLAAAEIDFAGAKAAVRLAEAEVLYFLGR